MDLLSANLELYKHQRDLNYDRVRQIKEEQEKFTVLFFAMPIVIFHLKGKHYIGDGQHRLKALRELHTEGQDLSGFILDVRVWLCGSDEAFAEAFAERIYCQCNTSYNINGKINANTGKLYTGSASDAAVEVKEQIQKQFATQASKQNAPYFDPNKLLTELNKSGIMETKTVAEVVQLIINRNNTFKEEL
ncbi:MAG: hypothetical protein MUO21_11460, partial [Nitrososphaeraceae archaeon]|nr:hypothetical protein [Nitrososphaeraceae archaeon]